MIRAIRRIWLRLLLQDAEGLLNDCREYMRQTTEKIPQLEARCDAIRCQMRINEIPGRRTYSALSKFDGRAT